MEKSQPILTSSQVLAELVRHAEEIMEGCGISRLDHALQTATRAFQDGADDDWIIGALLHDIGGGLAPNNHDRFSAEVIRPFVREEVAWVVEHHGIFHPNTFVEEYSWESGARERFMNNIYFPSCEAFSSRWDQVSFDPKYNSRRLEQFVELMEQVFARPAFDPQYLQKGIVKGLPQLADH